MNREIKNERLYLHFSRHDGSLLLLRHEVRIGNQGKYTDESDIAWVQQRPKFVLFGFYNAFQGIGLCHPNRMNYTFLLYEDVKYWSEILRVMYNCNRRQFDQKTSIDIVAKTLAAMLSYLAINEHGYWFRITCYQNQIQAGHGPNRPRWANMYSIAVGRKHKYVDFLQCCKKAVKKGSGEKSNGIAIQLDAVIAKYKRLTGVDLKALGLCDVWANG